MEKNNTTDKPDFTSIPVGGVILASGDIEYNVGRKTVKLKVRNTGDRPIQIGSHFHFFEVNRYLEFDREKAFGYRLNIPATTAIRFEPGEEREVELVQYGGKQRVCGFSGLVNGYTGLEDMPSYYPQKIKAFKRMKKYGFKSVTNEEANAEYITK
jgi:urease subunit beta